MDVLRQADGTAFLRLSTGATMPFLFIGTGMVPRHAPAAGRKRRRSRPPTPGDVFRIVNSSLSLGFRGIDAAEVYPLFEEVGEALSLIHI